MKPTTFAIGFVSAVLIGALIMYYANHPGKPKCQHSHCVREGVVLMPVGDMILPMPSCEEYACDDP